jgi:hypothetical protein
VSAQNFQALEMETGIFPVIGKSHRIFSEPWRMLREFIQGLENGAPDFEFRLSKFDIPCSIFCGSSFPLNLRNL